MPPQDEPHQTCNPKRQLDDVTRSVSEEVSTSRLQFTDSVVILDSLADASGYMFLSLADASGYMQ